MTPHEPAGDEAARLAPEIAHAVEAGLRATPRRPVILAGGIAAGKTRTAERVVQHLRDRGISVGGILAPRRFEGGATVGYRVVDLAAGEEHEFAESTPPGRPVGRFYVRPEALRFARMAVHRAVTTCDVVFIDEVGRWELDGGGHADSVRELVASNAAAVLLVREAFVDDVIAAFGLRDAEVFHVAAPQLKRATGSLADAFWSMVDGIPFPLFVTVGEDGFPESRPMDLVLREGKTLWLPTSRASRKVNQIEHHPEVTLLFVDTDRFNYAALHGVAGIVTDPERRTRLWHEEWRDDWPPGPDDPDYILLRVDGVRGHVLRGPNEESGEIDLREP
ncbi:MAG: nucleoside-triphosphatase [Candidatus Bipolaricaulis sp.]|nr:nucleoside-triphosphatase [Candidatus Bipolaricaulis sp.]MDD5219700.1 nucleoside-triphosphatase [Candidatus Bipolaricaulis sp.]MDD5646594.1 nucleoside-triphosphatase [Candidatus Bipolaricaulis sp.]